MSVCGQSGQTEEDSASEETGAPNREKPSEIQKQKPVSKVVRVLTVLAYLLSVSLAAILLSVYYICVWKSPELPLSETAELSARRGNRSDYGDFDHAEEPLHIYGGGDTAVNGSIISTPPENITSGFTNVNVSDSTTDTTQDAPVLPDTSTISQGLLDETSDGIGPYNATDSIT